MPPRPPVAEAPDSLRVAILAGTLGRGGAEKQLVYIARALRDAGVGVRVYTLGEGEHHETALRDAGLRPIGVGRWAHPLMRLATLARALRPFRPHVVHAMHFYMNLYAVLAARLSGALDVGAAQSDVVLDVQETGRWGPLSLRAPSALVTNSTRARATAIALGMRRDKIHLLANVIDTTPFERAWPTQRGTRDPARAVAILVATLLPVKRIDRFLDGLALARRSVPGLSGVIVGDGPERTTLEARAARLGLLPDGVEFRGTSDEVPRCMAAADMLVLTSDHEGLPNVLLEAMAARLPVVTTPAGDAGLVIEDGVNGFVVGFDAVDTLAERLIRLARSPGLRSAFGEAGYARVRARYACAGLAQRVVAVYRTVAEQRGHRRLLVQLARLGAEAGATALTAAVP